MAEIDGKQIARLESLLVVLQDVVDSLRGQSVTVSPEVAARIEQFRQQERCLFCELPLGKRRATRGCHQVCYQKVNRKINARKFTMQFAVDRGWINPIDETPGRKTDRPDPTRQLPTALKSDPAAQKANAAFPDVLRAEAEERGSSPRPKRAKR